jgi:hypothetical protein
VAIVVNIDGHPSQALVDSGSLGDFMSSTLAEQLSIQKIQLEVSLQVQLAIQRSCSKINFGGHAQFDYQGINKSQYFDNINLSSYDLILSTPWRFQHCVTFGINPLHVVVGSILSVLLKGVGVNKLSLQAMAVFDKHVDAACDELVTYAIPLCQKASETGLPPMRAINHTIPLIEEGKIYLWHLSGWPEPL